MRISTSKYFLKLILFCLLLSIFPTIFLGLYASSKASNIVQETIIGGNIHKLLQAQQGIEQILSKMDYGVTKFLNSSMVDMALKQSFTPYDFTTVHHFTKELNNTQAYELGTQFVYFVNLDKDWIIDEYGLGRFSTSRNREELTAFLNTKSSSSWVTEKKLVSTQTDSSSSSVLNTNFVYLVKKVPFYVLKPQGLMIIKISLYEIEKILSKNEMIGQSIVLDSSYNIIASTGEYAKGKKVLFPSFSGYIHNSQKGEGYFTQSIDGKMALITYNKSSFSNWVYINIVCIEDITKESRTIQWATLLVCLIAFGISSVLIFWGSRRMYNPINIIYNSIAENDKKITQNRNDELKYIANKINILKENQTMLSTSNAIKNERLKELFTIKLLSGHLDMEEITQKIRMYDITIQWERMCVLTLQIDSLKHSEFNENELEIALFAINNMVSDLITDKNRFLPVIIDKWQVTVVGDDTGTDEEFQQFVMKKAKLIQKVVKEKLCISTSIGISNPFSHLTQAYNAFIEDQRVLKYRIHFGTEIIINVSDIHSCEQRIAPIPTYLHEQIMDAVKSGNKNEADELVHKFIENIFKEYAELSEYQTYLLRLLIDLIHLLSEIDIPLNALLENEESLYEQFFTLKTKEEIESLFTERIVHPIISLIEQHKEKHHSKLSNLIVNYINEKIDSDISLETCAKELNYNPNYLSKVFRKEMGICFSDYLSQHRLQIAKKWLVETDMKISEISSRLKYSNPQNFIRYFRKVVGETPGHYRSKNN